MNKINNDNLCIEITKLVNNDNKVVKEIYRYRDIYYSSIKDICEALNNDQYNIKYNELRHLISYEEIVDEIKSKFPNLSINIKYMRNQNSMDVKYATNHQIVSVKGHKTVSISTNNNNVFSPSTDEFNIVRINDNEYELNSELIGNSEELLCKLNNLGVDITRQQFRMIKGHNKVPKTITKNYPNLNYTSLL